jgi:hypothetical protein
MHIEGVQPRSDRRGRGLLCAAAVVVVGVRQPPNPAMTNTAMTNAPASQDLRRGGSCPRVSTVGGLSCSRTVKDLVFACTVRIDLTATEWSPTTRAWQEPPSWCRGFGHSAVEPPAPIVDSRDPCHWERSMLLGIRADHAGDPASESRPRCPSGSPAHLHIGAARSTVHWPLLDVGGELRFRLIDRGPSSSVEVGVIGIRLVSR